MKFVVTNARSAIVSNAKRGDMERRNVEISKWQNGLEQDYRMYIDALNVLVHLKRYQVVLRCSALFVIIGGAGLAVKTFHQNIIRILILFASFSTHFHSMKRFLHY